MTDLDPDGALVELGSVVLRTPGLAGTATLHLPGSGGMRDLVRHTGAMDAALAAHDCRSQLTVELADTREVRLGGAGMRDGDDGGDAAVVLQVPRPGPTFGQVLLSVDEAGTARWHAPQPTSAPADAAHVVRGSQVNTYLVPRRVVRTDEDAADRGLSGAVGKKLLQLFVFPLVDPVVGAVGKHFVRRWEQKRRPERLRWFTPADYADVDGGDDVQDADWSRLHQGRVLLFVHGTFSRAGSSFAPLPAATFQELYRRYDGRVLAYDHPTLHLDPAQNASALLSALPSGVPLHVDVVSHSRGGLVARELVEASHRSGAQHDVHVGRVVLVAVPNAGTALADTQHLGDLVDTYTNLLGFFPDNGVTDVMEVVLAVVRQIATGVHGGLPGLSAMDPGGEYLRSINVPVPAGSRYFGVAADFEPTRPGLREWAKDRLLDHVFGGAGNDLVVPSAGAVEGNGSSLFPLEEPLRLHSSHGVWHSGYFQHDAVNDKLLAWLSGDAA